MNVTIIGLLTGIASSALCLIVLLFQHDIHITYSFIISALYTVLLGILCSIQLAWMTSALSIMAKSFIVPVAIMLPLVLGLSHMLFGIFEWAKYLPVLAVMNVFFIPAVNVYMDIWSGLAIQFAWAAILLVISSLLFIYRDVR